MARPRIDGMLDSSIRVWRPTESKGRVGQVDRSYTVFITTQAFINRSVAPVAPVGGGLAPTGRRRLYIRPNLNVQKRDVIEIIGGPEIATTWEVDEVPSQLKGHHAQLDCIAWHGILPEVTES